MDSENFSRLHRTIGIFSSLAVSILIVVYAITLTLGLISLASPTDPIGDPYFTIMEILIIVMMPVLVMVMITVHTYASQKYKLYSLMALIMMITTMLITSAVHFMILTVSRHPEMTVMPQLQLVLSFKWPSLAYSLDILAWDWFYALAMLFAAPVFNGDRLGKTIRALLYTSGILSLLGLIGIPLENMQIRMIGVVGYVGVTPFLFLAICLLFKRIQYKSI